MPVVASLPAGHLGAHNEPVNRYQGDSEPGAIMVTTDPATALLGD
jgi:hypothetical protein